MNPLKILFLSAVTTVAFFLPLGQAQASSLSSVARTLSKAAKKLPNKRIAVVMFPYHDGQVSSGSTMISERLVTLLVERHEVDVIERSQMAQVLTEMRLEESGVTDPESAQKLGKMLNVGAVVTGTLIDVNDDKTEINARLVQTETGEILAAANTSIDRTWPDSPHMPVVASTPEDENPPVQMSALIPVHPGPRRFRAMGSGRLYNALYTTSANASSTAMAAQPMPQGFPPPPPPPPGR